MIDHSNIPDAELRNTIAGMGGPPQQAAIAEWQYRQFAKLLQVAEAQKALAERLERQTETLIRLTRAVKLFTIILMLLTVGLLAEGVTQLCEPRKMPAPVVPQHSHLAPDLNKLPINIGQANKQ